MIHFHTTRCTKPRRNGGAFHLYLTDISKNVEFNKNKIMDDIRKKTSIETEQTEEIRLEKEVIEETLKLIEDEYKEEKEPHLQRLNELREQCRLLGHPNSKEDLSKSLPEFNCPDCGSTYNL